jgi:hypothetical protein
MTPEILKQKVNRAKKLKEVSKKHKNIELRSSAHKEASIIREELNQHYAKVKNRKKVAAPQKEYVYFLANPSFNVIKIGYTGRAIVQRIAELNSATSLPTEFELVGYIVSTDALKLEKNIHSHLVKWRPNPKREFFNISLNDAIKEIEKKFGVSVIRNKS